MESIWSKDTKIPERDSLNGNLYTEAAVIGAGMTGILTAFFLQELGFHVVVLEAGRIGSGQTKNTTAKITSQHGMLYAGLIQSIGERKAGLYARANEKAIAEYEKIIREREIACQFERLPSYLYSVKQGECLKKEAQAAAGLGIHASFTTQTNLPFAVQGAVRFENQAQFQPLKFIREIAKDLTIYERTRVMKVKKNLVFTDRGTVRADHIVFAAHYPILNVPGLYFLRQHQERSYVLALRGAEPLGGMYYSIDEGGLSLRSAGDILLLGGGRERTGKAQAAAKRRKEAGKPQEAEKPQDSEWNGPYQYLEQEAARCYPGKEIVARWSAQDCITHDGLPFIGQYSVFRPDWYVATGYQKWGMSTSMIAARLLCDSICGMENSYAALFTPKRFYPFGLGAFAKDAGESTEGLLKGALHLPALEAKRLKNGQGGIVRIGGERYACYRDENGTLYKMSARCPHMGCELAWNPAEKSFDCPCHGSRFSYDGQLLDNPAQKNCKNCKTYQKL